MKHTTDQCKSSTWFATSHDLWAKSTQVYILIIILFAFIDILLPTFSQGKRFLEIGVEIGSEFKLGPSAYKHTHGPGLNNCLHSRKLTSGYPNVGLGKGDSLYKGLFLVSMLDFSGVIDLHCNSASWKWLSSVSVAEMIAIGVSLKLKTNQCFSCLQPVPQSNSQPSSIQNIAENLSS